MRTVTTRTGSTFVRCARSERDPRFPKYPPLPVLGCVGYERQSPAGQDAAAGDRQEPA
jgi:hypothetical protein